MISGSIDVIVGLEPQPWTGNRLIVKFCVWVDVVGTFPTDAVIVKSNARYPNDCESIVFKEYCPVIWLNCAVVSTSVYWQRSVAVDNPTTLHEYVMGQLLGEDCGKGFGCQVTGLAASYWYVTREMIWLLQTNEGASQGSFITSTVKGSTSVWVYLESVVNLAMTLS